MAGRHSLPSEPKHRTAPTESRNPDATRRDLLQLAQHLARFLGP
jgi:hypothetical protein